MLFIPPKKLHGIREKQDLEKPETEKELRVSPALREVRLDVSLLEPGSKDFNLLNDSCFILIAPFDIFGRGLYRYTFEEVCRECPDLKLEDGAVRVFINTKGTNKEDFSQEFLDFMEYIEKTTDKEAEKTESKRIRQIHGRVRQIRRSEKVGIRYMQRWEELEFAREDGIAEGKIEGKIEAVLQLLEMIGPVSKELRERIMAESNDRILGTWLVVASRADSINEFIEKMGQ